MLICFYWRRRLLLTFCKHWRKRTIQIYCILYREIFDPVLFSPLSPLFSASKFKTLRIPMYQIDSLKTQLYRGESSPVHSLLYWTTTHYHSFSTSSILMPHFLITSPHYNMSIQTVPPPYFSFLFTVITVKYYISIREYQKVVPLS